MPLLQLESFDKATADTSQVLENIGWLTDDLATTLTEWRKAGPKSADPDKWFRRKRYSKTTLANGASSFVSLKEHHSGEGWYVALSFSR